MELPVEEDSWWIEEAENNDDSGDSDSFGEFNQASVDSGKNVVLKADVI